MTENLLPLIPTEGWDEDSINAVIDADGTTWSSPFDALVGGVLGFCGCGYGDQRNQDIHDVLFAVGADAKSRDLPEHLDENYVELILCVLDNEGLVDHGTTIAHSWLTPLGEQWVAALEEHAPSEKITKKTL